MMIKNYASNCQIIKTDKYFCNGKVVRRTLACLFLLSIVLVDKVQYFSLVKFSRIPIYTEIQKYVTLANNFPKLTFKFNYTYIVYIMCTKSYQS